MKKGKQQMDAYAEIDAITDVDQLRFLVKWFGNSYAQEIHSEDPDWPTEKEINRVVAYMLDYGNKEWKDWLAGRISLYEPQRDEGVTRVPEVIVMDDDEDEDQ